MPSIRSTQNTLHTARRLAGLLLLLFALLSSCRENPTPTPSAVTPLPVTPDAQPNQTVGSATIVPTNDQLVVWLPAFTGLAVEGSAGATLTNAFHQFEQRHPAVRLDVQVKSDAGTSSLFNFLRSAQEVAPSILPDLVLINTQQLWQLVDLGIVTALQDGESLTNANFFRVTNDAVTYHEQTIGIPYAADLIHLVYDSELTGTPPATWQDLLSGDAAYLFPAGEGGTANGTLLHYIGAGGTLMEDGSIVSPEALEAYFTFLAQARENDIIPVATLEMNGFTAVWRAFTEDRSSVAAVQANQFYPNATGIKPPSYRAVPTREGTNLTIAETWAFAILTDDPQRRQVALELISELLAPEVHGPWSQAVARLPSQPASLAVWTQTDGYPDFVQTQLENAVAPFNGPAFADFARRLHSAQAGILRGDLTVEAAIASMTTIE